MFETPSFRKVMGRDRFIAIRKYARMYDADRAIAEGWDDNKSENYDPLFKLRPFLEASYRGFRKHWAPAQMLSVDEQVIIPNELLRNKNVPPMFIPCRHKENVHTVFL